MPLKNLAIEIFQNRINESLIGAHLLIFVRDLWTINVCEFKLKKYPIWVYMYIENEFFSNKIQSCELFLVKRIFLLCCSKFPKVKPQIMNYKNVVGT